MLKLLKMYANKVTPAREDIMGKKGVKSRWRMGVHAIIKVRNIEFSMVFSKNTLSYTTLNIRQIRRVQLGSVTENRRYIQFLPNLGGGDLAISQLQARFQLFSSYPPLRKILAS